MTQPESIVVGRNQDSRPSHLGELLPEFARKAGGIARIAKLAQVGQWCVLGEKTPRIVAEHGLFRGKYERHLTSTDLPQTRESLRPGKIENAFGYDVELHFAGAAFD